MIRLRDEKTGKTKFMSMEWMDIERVLATAMPAWVAWAAVGIPVTAHRIRHPALKRTPSAAATPSVVCPGRHAPRDSPVDGRKECCVEPCILRFDNRKVGLPEKESPRC